MHEEQRQRPKPWKLSQHHTM